MSREDDILGDPKLATTFPQFIRATAAAYGDDIAIRLKGDTIPDDALTFRELDDRSAELARGLIARGAGKGSRIGFIQGNGPSFALMLAAIARIGAIAIPFSTLIKSNELVRMLRQSDVCGLIVQRRLLGHDYVDRLCEALPDLRKGASPELRIAQTPYLRWIISAGDDLPPTFHDMRFLTDAAPSVSEDMLREIESEVHTTDQMIEIYTSGSMALPKGVRHNHGPILFRTHYIRSMIVPERGTELGAPLPMFWIGGLMMFLMPHWEVGATTICTEGTSTSSSHALGSVLADEDLKAVPKMATIWGLGMTETIGPYSYADERRVPGYPLCAPLDHIADRYEVRVADTAGRPVAEGEIGEIQIRGYALTPGLHKVERDLYFTPDGFYHTGDLGLVQGSRILFTGRDGDMIKTASANVSPAEVEQEMQQLDGIHSAYVVGLPDTQRGQLVVAAVVPREGAELDFADIEGKLRQRLSSYKVPRAYVAITRAEVPMLLSNKVSRRQIERLMAQKLGRA
ncbi:Acyl-CoA synthetase (AMP-forming)/AMP-acid ligase II [Sphingomonas sp. YR710]|uniref:class I adenylate-forming enzyme family protein n=1 Tax=Sphingomonas sp. YR710 TaxID=1882773 RepID=UPI0008865B72|nr:class I adenylate-forming enzyme family protein [Sphingomonas sp. YR710]SDC52523.1 Acyl-CoA synthetase (AMP-forming)/AMP-acid ligase II [Sphingomonas sp. YR710]